MRTSRAISAWRGLEFSSRRITASALLIALTQAVLASECQGQFRTPEWKNFHNNTFVGEEPEPIRTAFFTATEHLAEGREFEAGRELLRVARTELVGLVPHGERLVLPIDQAVALRLLSLSEDTRRALREADAGAVLAVQAELRGPDDRKTRERLWRQFPLHAGSERAWFELGVAELLKGHGESASCYFERLVHWPAVGPGTVRGAAAGRLRQWQGRHGEPQASSPLMRWPESEVVVRGESVALTTLDVAAATDSGPEWPTYLGDLSRSRLVRHEVDPERAARWCVPVEQEAGFDPMRAEHRRRFQPGLRDEQILPSGLPILTGDQLISLEPDGIHVRALSDGQDVFPALRWDFDLHVDPDRFDVELEGSAASLHGTMLYVNLRVADRASYPERAAGALIGIDLAREGYVRFSWRSWEQEPEGNAERVDPWGFAGPPVAMEERLFLPAMRLVENDTECELFCFDAESGALLERRFLARGRAVDRFADRFASDVGRRLVSPSPISARAGVLYVCTNLGVVSAVRAADLGVEWVFRYNRIVPVDSRRYTQEVFYVTGGWPSRAIVAMPDRLLVAPADSRYLYSLARWPSPAGDLVLNDPVEKETRLAWIGADAEKLYFLVRTVAGRTDPQVSVQATDHSGSWLWQTAPLPIQEPIAGLPAQTDRYLYLPTDRLVYRVDLRAEGNWDLVLPPPESMGVPYPETGAFGDLVASPRWLISRSGSYLTAFEVPSK